MICRCRDWMTFSCSRAQHDGDCVMLILEIAGGVVIGVLILMFLAYWLFAGITGQDGAAYCCMIVIAGGSWFFSPAIGIAITAMVAGLIALIVLCNYAGDRK